MREGTRRSLGTVLMGIGLLLILSVGGYFALTEVQAAQVRNELDQGAAAAAARATRVAQAPAPILAGEAAAGSAATGAGGPGTATPAASRPAAAVKVALTATRTPALAATRTLEPRASATARPTRTLGSTAGATATEPPTVPPAATAAPLLPVRMTIADLKIDAKVVEMGWTLTQTENGPVSEWAIPKNAAGHHINSATLGQAGNLVISGHNNIYGRVFMPISQAWNNDKRVKVDNFTDQSAVLDGREIVLYDAAGGAHPYVITGFYRLKDTGVSQAQREINGKYILPTVDERVTIVTCWPPTNNTHRLIVIARPEK